MCGVGSPRIPRGWRNYRHGGGRLGAVCSRADIATSLPRRRARRRGGSVEYRPEAGRKQTLLAVVLHAAAKRGTRGAYGDWPAALEDSRAAPAGESTIRAKAATIFGLPVDARSFAAPLRPFERRGDGHEETGGAFCWKSGPRQGDPMGGLFAPMRFPSGRTRATAGAAKPTLAARRVRIGVVYEHRFVYETKRNPRSLVLATTSSTQVSHHGCRAPHHSIG